jgi:hypothetical protein
MHLLKCNVRELTGLLYHTALLNYMHQHTQVFSQAQYNYDLSMVHLSLLLQLNDGSLHDKFVLIIVSPTQHLQKHKTIYLQCNIPLYIIIGGNTFPAALAQIATVVCSWENVCWV